MSKTNKNSEVHVPRKSPRFNQVSEGKQTFKSNLHKMKQNNQHQRKKDVYIEDVFEKANTAKNMIHGSTGLVYDLEMAHHQCLWYPSHQECPERFTNTLNRCRELGIVDRCKRVEGRQATEEELLTVHSQEHIDRLKGTASCTDLDHLEQLASEYDAIYIHPETYELALKSAGCTIQLVNEICQGTVQNGMAIVRPPGHHAMHNEFCGYCYFNNVAVAAHHGLLQNGVHKVLIVDWDVHHGQATQQMFYNDPRVLYFSIHRYEHGEFWPNLRESDFDYIGEEKGAGFNFNVPLNQIDMGDADYMAIFHQLLLPVASEFQPDLVIVSAGYDAAVGCPEGEMSVTPACYAHLISSLIGLASGKVAVILEGGYCVRSLAEGAALTLRALLGDPCPNLPPLPAPSLSIQESILNCVYSHREYWQCYQLQDSYVVKERDSGHHSVGQHWPSVLYNYSATTTKPESYPTRNCCPVQTQDTKDKINEKLDSLIAETKLLKPTVNVCFVYDPVMMEHRNLNDFGHPEQPGRIQKIYERHVEFNLLDRLFLLQSRTATREELLLVHEENYLTELQSMCTASSAERLTDDIKSQHLILEKKNSVYIHPQSYTSASWASGSLLQVVDSVMQGQSKAGVAIIRPPGHHAESYQACGFCFFNNVSIAARYAINKYSVKRILILDWDVHHGNGTQRIFLSDPQVLYISIHRYDRGNFFPSSQDAAATVIGSGPGVGFNVNIPWNQKGMGNAEYIAAFHQLVLPIAYQFAPELVLVSAGFDAAVGDPLGGCKVTPEAYGLFTSWLAPLAMGRVIVCLEGGYNLTTISYAMTMCTKALLGDPLPSIDTHYPLKPGAIFDLRTVLNIQSKHWSAVCFNKSLPRENVLDLVENKENISMEDTQYLYHKMSITEKVPAEVSIKMEDQSIQDLEIQFSSALSILGDSPSAKELPKPNLSDWNNFARQIPNDKSDPLPNDSKPERSEQTQPGPSQGMSASGEAKKLQQTTLDAILKDLGMDEGFAVHPRHDCPHLPEVAPVPHSGISVTAPCQQCLPESPDCATIENWVCLTCYSVHCGRVVKEHMLHHSLELSHSIVLGFQDLSVWCYKCNSYIESPVLYDAKNSAYMSKFGQAMPYIYGTPDILTVIKPN